VLGQKTQGLMHFRNRDPFPRQRWLV
jgi:hypothetical protein